MTKAAPITTTEIVGDEIKGGRGVQRVYPEASGSVSMVQVAGEAQPSRHVQGCKTCEAGPFRLKIENYIVAGYSFQKISDMLPESLDISRHAISRHFNNNHMPIHETHRRIIIEEQAKEMGLNPEDHHSILANHVTFARLGITQVLQEMAEGKQTPDISQAIQMAQFLDKVESRAGAGTDVEALNEIINVFFDAVLEEVGSDHVQAIARRAEYDPRMATIRRKLMASVNGEDYYEDIEDAEVVED